MPGGSSFTLFTPFLLFPTEHGSSFRGNRGQEQGYPDSAESCLILCWCHDNVPSCGNRPASQQTIVPVLSLTRTLSSQPHPHPYLLALLSLQAPLSNSGVVLPSGHEYVVSRFPGCSQGRIPALLLYFFLKHSGSFLNYLLNSEFLLGVRMCFLKLQISVTTD